MFTSPKLRPLFVIAILCLLCAAGWSDSLELRNGSLIKGKYLGGTEREISFEVGSTIQHYAVADVVSISFDTPARSSVPEVAPQRSVPEDTVQAAPQLTPRHEQPQTSTASSHVNRFSSRTVLVPSGTRLLVRTIDAIDSEHNQVGDHFQATLEEPLVINDVTVVPKGADVYGELKQATQAGHIQGRSQLMLELTGINVNGQTVSLQTGEYSVAGSSRGASTAKRVGGGAAVGAIIGAIAGGGKGAAIGAGVGAGAGTAVQVVTKGEQVKVPSETLLEFSLEQDVNIPVAAVSSGPAR